MAKKSDLMIIIGGKHSSNTAKLYDVCKPHCVTYLIETAQELPVAQVKAAKNVGITAGASTPAIFIIKEVLVTMTDIKAGEGHFEENTELSFAEMLEESLKSLNTDEKVRGVVVGIAPNEIQVDVGRKQAGFVPASELSSDPNAKPEDIVKIGDEIELLIMRTNDQEGTIMLSKNVWMQLKAGTLLQKQKKTVIVSYRCGYRSNQRRRNCCYQWCKSIYSCFSSNCYTWRTTEELAEKEVNFRIIEVNRSCLCAVGSIRAVLKDERKELADKFWENC